MTKKKKNQNSYDLQAGHYAADCANPRCGSPTWIDVSDGEISTDWLGANYRAPCRPSEDTSDPDPRDCIRRGGRTV